MVSSNNLDFKKSLKIPKG